MPVAEVAVGQVAVVTLTGDDRGEPVRGPVERVFEKSLTVAVPEPDVVPTEFEPTVPVTVTYSERVGLYTFPGRVTLREERRVVVERVGPIEEVQRRQYVRLSGPVPVECLTVDDVTGKLFSLEATTINVSGGGLALEARRLSAPNIRVVVALKPEHVAPILAVGTVIASERTVPGSDKVVTRVTFVAIAEADRERLIKYVFENLR